MAQLNLLSVILVSYICGISSETCKRNVEQLFNENRDCSNYCSHSKPCLSPRYRCICDGPCGYVCVAPDLRCPSLKTPLFASVNFTNGLEFKSIAMYTCDIGFELVGSKERICQSSGMWNGEEPYCASLGIRCSRPTFSINNIEMIKHRRRKTFSIGEELTFQCKYGFVSSGEDSATTVCQVKNGQGYWTSLNLTCTAMTCPEPENISNGFIDGEDFSIGSRIAYRCEEGYQLSGFSRRICFSSQKWSGTEPICQIVTCRRPRGIFRNGKVIYEIPLEFGKIVRYECDEGFTLSGNRFRKCEKDAKLSGHLPKCLELLKRTVNSSFPCSCSSLKLGNNYLLNTECDQEAENGSKILEADCDFNSFGDRIEIQCKDGEWIFEESLCQEIANGEFCNPPDIPNSKLEIFIVNQYVTLTPNSTIEDLEAVRVSCKTGFHFEDSNNDVKFIFCIDGIFFDLPECVSRKKRNDTEDDLSCFYSNSDQNLLAFNSRIGQIKENAMIHLNETIFFRCAEITKFSLMGDNEISCGPNGLEGKIPSCINLYLRIPNFPSVITYNVNGEEVIGENGTLYIPNHSQVILYCWSFRSLGDPVWLCNNESCEEQVEWDHTENFLLRIQNFTLKYNGLYSCTNPYNKTHAIDIRVKSDQPTLRTKIFPTRVVETESTIPSKITPTTIRTTNRPSRRKNDQNCDAQEDYNLDVFANGRPIKDAIKRYVVGTVLVFRCSNFTHYTLTGNKMTICDQGNWSNPWPECKETKRNDRSSPPSMTIFGGSFFIRMENGEFWFPKKSDISVLCDFKWEKPTFLINNKSLEEYKKITQIGFHTVLGYYIRFVDTLNKGSFTVDCIIPTETVTKTTLKNSVSIRIGATCAVDESQVFRRWKAGIQFISLRHPFYIEGDRVFLKCLFVTEEKIIPQFIKCDEKGDWISSVSFTEC